ncbi:MAG TPA: S-adenosylmethionine:tRNA ribosyltransferase-isomerase [Candidatus Eremiobacteraceae bacterium]|nr:S-adenosylmethionine:tRNA ribosyltransferase-isomerase [Candidatus Eremiobacteraceae bacterium]
MPFAETRQPAAAASPYTFVVPPELEAREPAEIRGASRDDVRLLVTDPIDGVRHTRFERLPDHLESGDLIVLNDTKTYPAAVRAVRRSGESVLLHFARFDWQKSVRGNLPNAAWSGFVLCEPRKATPAPGERVELPGGGTATFNGLHRASRRMWETTLELPLPYFEYFARFGKPVAYAHLNREYPIETFQTAYARSLGSSEMPSAGRPFTSRILRRLALRGVDVATITLHAGVSSAERDEHPLEEWREVSADAACAVRRASTRGGRIIAVGTTVVRALESSLDRHRVIPSRGWTGLHITRERPMRVVSGLLTGFHEPTSSHLAILESLTGPTHIQTAYDAALRERYLWHEFGDAHLMLA